MFLEQFYAIALLVISVSHIVQARMWVEFFATLRKTGYAALIIAMFTLPQGLAIVVYHNIWIDDFHVVLTIMGWGMTIKSVLYLWFPRIADKMIDGPGSTTRGYVAGGFVGLLIALMLAYVGFDRRY